jgi:hypothetical protein
MERAQIACFVMARQKQASWQIPEGFPTQDQLQDQQTLLKR